jgi:hypothetical protein
MGWIGAPKFVTPGVIVETPGVVVAPVVVEGRHHGHVEGGISVSVGVGVVMPQPPACTSASA